MPGLQGVIRTATAPARFVGSVVANAIGTARRDAPGARMVGEFTVKMGLREVGRRLSGRRPQGQ